MGGDSISSRRYSVGGDVVAWRVHARLALEATYLALAICGDDSARRCAVIVCDVNASHAAAYLL